MHEIPHWPAAEHVALPLAVPGQGVHDDPHVAGSELLTHDPPQAWKPALHANSHLPPAQETTPLATAGHAMLQSPQWLTLVFRSTHWLPQRVGAAAVQPVAQAKLPAPSVGAHTGADAGQTALHAPQCEGCERSVSQPSTGLPLQSA